MDNCPPRLPGFPLPPNANDKYDLPGPQVEPHASYWTQCKVPCVVTIPQILAGFTPDPYPTIPADLDEEIDELRDLAAQRDNPGALVSRELGRERSPISAFLQLRPQSLGAVYNRERAQRTGALCDTRCHPQCGDQCSEQLDADDVTVAPIIRTGRELARYFEAETPGIAHRQALNYLFLFTNWSPPRQALVWMALDVAIYSALAAAWYFKWLAPDMPIGPLSRRPRPIEYDPRLSVLYDREVDCDGDADGMPRMFPKPSPGTPRHPAYPSGHSTYSAAASEVLSYFFPESAAEFDNLANNAGIARLWAGIHWRSDHTFGDRLGRHVARLVIEQLQNSCVTAPPDQCEPVDPCPPIPTIPELKDCANECCGGGKKGKGGKAAYAASSAESDDQGRGRRGSQSRRKQGRESTEVSSSAEREQARGPQQGAAAAVSREDELAQARSPQQGAPTGRSSKAERERARSPQQGAG